MGAGASSLTAEQKAALTRRLEEAYNQLSADGLEEDIVKDSMQSEYKKIMKSLQKPEPVKTEPVILDVVKPERPKPETIKMSTSSSNKEVGLSSKFSRPGSSSKNNKGSKFSRRRSFDEDNKSGASQKNRTASLKAAAAEAAAAVTKMSSTSEEVVDSWDSVTQQPFCTICQMAFKSVDFLNRHVKYSDLHTKNVEKCNKKDGRIEEVFQKVAVIEEEPQPQVVAAMRTAERQVEGQHYKLFYTGSKFFWRTQKNIDVDIYLHILPHVIEVISFDPVKHREASRIYLNYYTIQSTLEKLVAGDLEVKLKELAQDRFHSLEDDTALREQLLLQRVITYILQRLQLDTSGHLGEMKFVEQYGDSDLQSPLLLSPPLTLVPVSLTRRRRTSAEEIEATINSISFDRTAIGEAINLATNYSSSLQKTKSKQNALSANLEAASRISAHVHGAIQYMSTKRWYNDVSLPKKRFIKAVRKVIRQALVNQTKANLVARETTLRLLPAGSPDFSMSKSRKSARSRPREV